MFENASGLLHGDDPDVEQSSDLMKRADLSARLAAQDQVAELRGGRLNQLTFWNLCHATELVGPEPDILRERTRWLIR
jgi:hypothetical protein